MAIKITGQIPNITGPVQLEVPTSRYSGKADDTDASVSINPYTGLGPGASGQGLVSLDVETLRGNAVIVSAPFSEVELLVNFDDFIIRDRSDNNREFTSNGVTSSSTQAKFGTYSGLFNGSSGLEVDHDTGIDVWDGSDFTVEAWIYPTSSVSGAGLFSKATSGAITGTDGWQLLLDDLTLSLITIESGSQSSSSASMDLSLNTWTHVALVKDGSGARVYQDGVQVINVGSAPSNLSNAFNFLIGEDRTANTEFNGHMDSIRITKGTARYKNTFSNEDSFFNSDFDVAEDDDLGTDPNFSNVVLLMNFISGAEGSTNFVEESGRTISAPFGNPQYSNQESRTGNASLLLNGSSAIQIADNSLFAFGNSDFTIEAWVNFISHAGDTRHTIIGQYNTSDDPESAWWLGFSSISASRPLRLILGNNPTVAGVNSNLNRADFVVGTWYHIAVVRESGTVRFYRDGDYQGGGILNTAVANVTVPLTIGKINNLSSTFLMNGYMDSVRVTRNVARYTGTTANSFTPPSGSFPTS